MKQTLSNRPLLQMAIVAVVAFVLILIFDGCGESITKAESDVPTLAQVRRSNPSAAISTETVDQIKFEFYRGSDSRLVAICAYVRPDSCLVIALDDLGNPAPPAGKKGNIWDCLSRGIQMCNQIYGEPQDPELIARKNHCLATSMAACYLTYGLFGWFCS